MSDSVSTSAALVTQTPHTDHPAIHTLIAQIKRNGESKDEVMFTGGLVRKLRPKGSERGEERVRSGTTHREGKQEEESNKKRERPIY